MLELREGRGEQEEQEKQEEQGEEATPQKVGWESQ